MAGKTGDSEVRGGLSDFILPLAIVTVLGGGGGGFLGASILPGLFQPPPGPGQAAEGESKREAEGDHGPKAPAKAHESEKHGKTTASAPASGALAIKELPPIVANLSGAGRPLIRLQSAILYNAEKLPHPDALLASLRSDIVGFLATLELSAIEGPDGLRRLQEELRERAVTRSEGQVSDVIIETLVIQ